MRPDRERPDRKRHFVIGDIHGHLRALDALLDCIAPASGDRITFLGDYVDHGPHSKDVIDTIVRLGDIARPIAGNHEMYLLGALTDSDVEREWLRCGGAATLASFGVGSVKDIPVSYIDWLDSLPWYIEDAGHLFVHAGVNPQVPMAAQTQEDLMWRHWSTPIVLQSGKTLVCGHRPTASPFMSPTCICLDGGIARGGVLSCYECESRTLYRSDASGRLLNSKAA